MVGNQDKLKDMYLYRLSFSNQINNAWPILIYLLIFSVLPFYMIFKYGNNDTAFFFLLSVLGFSFFFIPHLIIHINYYKKNQNFTFFYDANNLKITIGPKDKMASFSLNEILCVICFKSYPFSENRMQWFPWDSYNYSIIQLKNGEEFTITSLLVPNMELPIDPHKIRLEKRFYPIVKGT